MYEHRRQPLLGRPDFARRVARHAAAGAALIGASLGIGVLGYRNLAGLGWIDALLNASMILSGMGPVSPLPGDAAKVFASAYALYSGLVLLITVAILVAPLLHRIMHRLHLEDDRGPRDGA
jgi:hypothetical protein